MPSNLADNGMRDFDSVVTAQHQAHRRGYVCVCVLQIKKNPLSQDVTSVALRRPFSVPVRKVLNGFLLALFFT